MHPIQKLLKKNIKFEWTEECDKAFQTAKETLVRDPILYHLDPHTPWIIETDASKSEKTEQKLITLKSLKTQH